MCERSCFRRSPREVRFNGRISLFHNAAFLKIQPRSIAPIAIVLRVLSKVLRRGGALRRAACASRCARRVIET